MAPHPLRYAQHVSLPSWSWLTLFHARTVQGTFDYRKADLWAVACMAYELVGLEHPWRTVVTKFQPPVRV